jgi:hypothetical protein
LSIFNQEPSMNQPSRRPHSSRNPSPNLSRSKPFPATVLDDSVPIDERRLSCHDMLIRFSRGLLDNFVETLLSDDRVVYAFSACRVFEGASSDRTGTRTFRRANDTSVLAARRAANSKLLAPGERSVAGVAAYLYGLGFYQLSFQLDRCKPPALQIGLQHAQAHRHALLDAPLRKLRSEHPDLGALLTASLGLGSACDCEPEQLARVFSAVRLANLPYEQSWLGDWGG